ncbi:MAG: clostripain-related cysteine peptidase [Bacteroidales bacterium]|nr:clostripain-related cysteine peptidase [Bacteroidales bacterium]
MKRLLNSFASLLVLAAALIITSACHKVPPVVEKFSHVAIYYGCGFNNLSEGMKKNVVTELASGEIPGRNDTKALLAFCHNTYEPYNYTDANSPVLLRIYRDNGHTVIDTVETYPMLTVSASAQVLSSVLNEIRDKYKSDSYGLIFSSHASGWLPEGYRSPSNEKSTARSSLGSQFRGSSSVATEIDIKDFADAIPFKMDYIILDCCLSGAVEVAWELREVCDRIVFSPTEVLSGGYDYVNMPRRIFSQPADLEGVCDDHYGKYSYSTTTLVDCSEIERVAAAVSSVIASHKNEFDAMKATSVYNRTVQRYFYQTNVYTYFYDLRHLAVKLGASKNELDELDAALRRFVIYERHSQSFLEGLMLNNVCGVSMYIPNNQWPVLNNYYSGLGWNEVTKVVDK